MGKSNVLADYLERYRTEAVTVNPYVVRKIGLIHSQTFLRLEDYQIICIPYQLSFSSIILLGILSPQEITFFQQYQNVLCSLTMTYQDTRRKQTKAMLIRANLVQIGAMKNRDNICLFRLSLRSVPNLLVEILGTYFSFMEMVRKKHRELAGRQVEMKEPGTAGAIGYTGRAEAIAGSKLIPLELIALAVDGLTARVSSVHGNFRVDMVLPVKLTFRSVQLTVRGTVREVSEAGNIFLDLRIELEFTPDLVELLESWFSGNRLAGDQGDKELSELPVVSG